MNMAMTIEYQLFEDPQDVKATGNCRTCGGELFGAGCPYCRTDRFQPLEALAPAYRAAAKPLRQRLRSLRQALDQATDPEQVWHLKRRIAELTPMLTQMNELAELTEHYYDRGYWRSEKYTL